MTGQQFIKIVCLLCLGMIGLPACSNSTASKIQPAERTRLIQKATAYSARAYDAGDVPLHAMVKVAGTVGQTDGKNQKFAQKHDRFILEMATGRLQVFNNQEQTFQTGDQVTVYGEYYGFVQSRLIEVIANETEH